MALADADEQLRLRGAEIAARTAELDESQRRLDELEQVATRLSECVVERDVELRRVRAELVRATEQAEAQHESLTATMGEVDELRRTARGQATRIRLGALREAADLSERVAELTKRPAGMRERLLEALTDAIARIGTADESDEADEPRVPEVRPPALIDAADLFEGVVQVEVGPLSDFSQLVEFEDAANSIEAAAEISVKRFSDGRATLEVQLREPVALLRELKERSELTFVARDRSDDRLVLDVDGHASQAA